MVCKWWSWLSLAKTLFASLEALTACIQPTCSSYLLNSKQSILMGLKPTTLQSKVVTTVTNRVKISRGHRIGQKMEAKNKSNSKMRWLRLATQHHRTYYQSPSLIHYKQRLLSKRKQPGINRCHIGSKCGLKERVISLASASSITHRIRLGPWIVRTSETSSMLEVGAPPTAR